MQELHSAQDFIDNSFEILLVLIFSYLLTEIYCDYFIRLNKGNRNSLVIIIIL